MDNNRKEGTGERHINLSGKEIDLLFNSERNEYYKTLYDYCENLNTGKPHITLVQKIISKLLSASRKYSLEIRGEENLPRDGVLIMCNHSNTHDAFTAAEALYSIGLPSTFFATSEGLSPILVALFKAARASLMQRNNKESANNAVLEMASKLIHGDTCVIFGESVWNLHPMLPMLNLKTGGAKMAAISQKPIIPTIFEYVEVPSLCCKEQEIYEKCIVTFGKPYIVDRNRSLITQTKEIQNIMEQTRKEIWRENGIKKDAIEDIDVDFYINHTGLKVFESLAAFDYEKEKSYVLSVDGQPVEYMYTLDDSGNFIPGELTRAVFEKTLNR